MKTTKLEKALDIIMAITMFVFALVFIVALFGT